jgi:hypothetical protein
VKQICESYSRIQEMKSIQEAETDAQDSLYRRI